ncbi:MAG: hypothetical protein HHJ11_17370 [Phycicoccus sp.]|nr:hypothetical protein [Phycicoccus sp.]
MTGSGEDTTNAAAMSVEHGLAEATVRIRTVESTDVVYGVAPLLSVAS